MDGALRSPPRVCERRRRSSEGVRRPGPRIVRPAAPNGVMPPALAQREFALAAVALLALVVGLAIASGRGESASGTNLPPRVGDWQTALAGLEGRSEERRVGKGWR